MSTDPPSDHRRAIPQVDRLVGDLQAHLPWLPRPLLVDAVRAAVQEARSGRIEPTAGEVTKLALAQAVAIRSRLLQPVVNVTGVVLHTNLGRAPLSTRALEQVVAVASGYSNLEFDLESGRRGSRFGHTEPLLARCTGAEAALVVNNNAAAVLLVCTALAAGREVVISRGELIEIGGQFRIPDVLATSGAILREVGTTNRTHLTDYESAIGERTALVLKVHPSNYRVVGFTAAPSTAELAGLARVKGIPLAYDVGSGLLDGRLADEPTVTGALSEGADLVCFSGDKLAGGPQAGIVCGRADLVSSLRRHPLMRALRPDKMTLAALAATVADILNGEDDAIPVRRMLSASYDSLRTRAESLAAALVDSGVEAAVVDGASVAGGGSLPGHTLATATVVVATDRADDVAASMRRHDPPVVARVTDEGVVIDLRTAEPAQDVVVAGAAAAAISALRGDSHSGNPDQHHSSQAPTTR